MRKGSAVDKRGLWLAFALWLAMATAFLFWFDYAAVSAIFHPQLGPAGRTVFQVQGYSNTVYPFTYAGAALSLVGVACFVFRQERAELGLVVAALLGLLVGNIASIGMINCYEQVFVGLLYYTEFGHAAGIYWLGYYWGQVGLAGSTLAGMIPVVAAVPWGRRRNWPGVSLFLGIYAISMGVWFLHGYTPPQSGDAIDYWANAVSRVSSQLVLVALVSNQDVLGWLLTQVRRIRTKFSRSSPAGASASSVPLRVEE